jgi:hypothetical protein
MGQFDSMGLKPVGRIGLSDSDRGIGLPKREDRPRPGTTVVTKKKNKPKVAAAGGGSNPPKNPPKGPTGPKNSNKSNDKKIEGKKNNSLGGLSKGTSFNADPRDAFKRKK